MTLVDGQINRESAEYTEILADFVVEILNKSAEAALSDENIPKDLTRSLIECLLYVFMHGDSSLKQISYGLSISVPAASQLVDRLVKKGLVARKEDETDRRIMFVEMTDKGTQTITSIRKKRTDWFASVLMDMSDSNRESLLAGLEGFITAATRNSDDINRACAKCGMKHVPFCILNKIKSSRTDQNG